MIGPRARRLTLAFTKHARVHSAASQKQCKYSIAYPIVLSTCNSENAWSQGELVLRDSQSLALGNLRIGTCDKEVCPHFRQHSSWPGVRVKNSNGPLVVGHLANAGHPQERSPR